MHYWTGEGGGGGVDLLLELTSELDLGRESPLPIIIRVNLGGFSAVPVLVLGGVRSLHGPLIGG